MENFSIGNNGVQSQKDTANPKKDNYAGLKKEYIRLKAKLNKSDFANSPVAIEKELSMIAKLKSVAKQQGLADELKTLEETEQSLYTKLANTSSGLVSEPYYKPISFKGTHSPKINEDAVSYLDYTQERFVNFLAQGFQDEETVKANLQTMSDMGIDINAAISILDRIKVKNSDSGLYQINQDSFKKLITIKKILAARDMEKEEYHSPINQIGVEVFSTGKDTIILKNGRAQYISPLEDKSIQCMQEEYANAVSDEEDKLLYDFASKYSDKNGEINSNYVRVLAKLRQAGIIRNQLLNCLDMCISPDGAINKDTLNSIAQLKKAGALSSDIKLIMGAFDKDEEDNFDKADIANAAALTQSVMTGKDVVSFLPAMRTGEEARDFIVNYSNLFGPEITSELLSLVSDMNGIPDENAMDVVNALLNNPSIGDENGEIKSKDFLDLARHMIIVAKDFNTSDSVSEDAVELIFQMCREAFPIEDIESLLSRCLDDKGKIDKTLAKILWHMTWNQNNKDKMKQVMDICSGNQIIASQNAKNILEFLEEET